jgi:hypothetical protein
MKKKILVILAVLAVPAAIMAASGDNVGLGVEGILLPTLSTGPTCSTAAHKGIMYYDTDDDRIFYCNGSAYKKLVNQ